MRVSDLLFPDLVARCGGADLILRTGPFIAEIRTDVDRIIHGVRILYGDFAVDESTEFADFHMYFVRSHRFPFRPHVQFVFDGESPFKALPSDQALAMFEWCFNWCISSSVNHYLVIHAAAVERGGWAAILPGPPGSGKSTLCAALVNRGWRLLTDELVLISLKTVRVIALARPIGLKNDSIEVIKEFQPGAVLGPECTDTLKGRVAHLRPPTDSVLRIDESSTPAWLIFPRYSRTQVATSRPVNKAQALMRTAASAFNYTILGTKGFEMLSRVIDRMDSYDFEYGVLDAAVNWFNDLAPPETILPHT